MVALSASPGAVWGAMYPKILLPLIGSIPTACKGPLLTCPEAAGHELLESSQILGICKQRLRQIG